MVEKGEGEVFFPLFLDSEELIHGQNFKIGYSFISIFLFLFSRSSIVTNIEQSPFSRCYSRHWNTQMNTIQYFTLGSSQCGKEAINIEQIIKICWQIWGQICIYGV